VAVRTSARKIKRRRIIQRYLATGPDDEGATANSIIDGDVLPYALKRDLAIFELERPIPQHHGLSFSLDELKVGQEVDIYAYPAGIFGPFLRQLTRFPAIFKAPTTSGLLAFQYELSDSNSVHIGGASGGIVVDRKTQKIVGILSSTTPDRTMALAVPVRNLADFVSKVQPFLAAKIFPTITEVSPLSADIYPKFVPSPDLYPQFIPNFAHVLERRPQEPHEVTVLRQKAQLLADSMRNYIAVQTFAWGSGGQEPSFYAAAEVRVVEGEQQYRLFPDGKTEIKGAPFFRLNRKAWTQPANEWSQLPKMVGTDYNLKVRQVPDAIVSGRRIKVFQYYSSLEDNYCAFLPFEDYIFFIVGKVVQVPCYGEVWTDEDTNIIRISESFDLSDKRKEYKGWEENHIVITYGWLDRPNEPPRLIPRTIFTLARHKKDKEVHWCQGQFIDYKVFTVHARIGLN
jgi:hypothetical protein